MEHRWRAEDPALDLARDGYQLMPFAESLIRAHAEVKFGAFRDQIDCDIFPSLGRREGCLKLMRQIAARTEFVPEATWLIQHRDRPGGRPMSVATIQGILDAGWGAIQNVGVLPAHRGRGLGRWLLQAAAEGFHRIGVDRVHLEVTTANESAIRLYRRAGYRSAGVVYKVGDPAGVI